MIDAVTDRLKSHVPALGNRVEGAAALLELVKSGRYPHSLGALVMPAGIRGGTADVATGIYQQNTVEAVSIILVMRATDRTGIEALENMRPIRQAVLTAIAGWAPENTVGVFELTDGRVASFLDGHLIYQINFSINDELRISP